MRRALPIHPSDVIVVIYDNEYIYIYI